jgi:hypothetical protein
MKTTTTATTINFTHPAAPQKNNFALEYIAGKVSSLIDPTVHKLDCGAVRLVLFSLTSAQLVELMKVCECRTIILYLDEIQTILEWMDYYAQSAEAVMHSKHSTENWVRGIQSESAQVGHLKKPSSPEPRHVIIDGRQMLAKIHSRINDEIAGIAKHINKHGLPVLPKVARLQPKNTTSIPTPLPFLSENNSRPSVLFGQRNAAAIKTAVLRRDEVSPAKVADLMNAFGCTPKSNRRRR